MQSDLGKLFVGGISWDTNEERLKEYFSTYGEVVEAVIMKDRATGRARGFGFIVFADPGVAERVIQEKHKIDGRMVEAKKAFPRDNQQTILSRNSGSIQGSPSQGRTRKIFVGGLASTVTESDFRNYFERFGTITDVVVMYDQNTKRPRGFGFITYDSEEAVDRVLVKTFHELSGKMVEVKRAVPKELSPGPSRSPLGGYNYGLSRVSSFLTGYTPSGVGGFDVRMDSRFSPIAGSRSGFPPFGSAYGMGLNFEPGLSPSYGASASFNNSPSYGRGLNPYFMGNSNRFVGYDGSSGGSSSLLRAANRNLWGNGGLSYGMNFSSSNAYVGSRSGSIGGNAFDNSGVNWGASPNSAQAAGNSSVDNTYALELGGYGRNTASTLSQTPSYANSGYDGAFGVYGDATWRSANAERDGPSPFGFGLSNAASDISSRSSTGYLGGYTVNNRQSARENLSFN